MLSVNVKWGKQKYTVDLNTQEPPIVFKSQLYALTGVPPDRQKVMGVKGGVLKDDADWSTLGVAEGHNFMLIGSADEIPKAPEKATVFVEDLSDEQAQNLIQSVYPPGLTNLGNTCYMNATLQCFRAVPELNAALRAFNGQISENDHSGSLTSALRELYLNMDTSNKTVMPLVFLTVLRRAFPQFAQQNSAGKDGHGGGYMQQDAEECWTQLMLTLSQKLPRAIGAGDEEGSSAASSSSSRRSAISDLFQGEIESSLKCIENDEPPTIKRENITKLICHIGNTTTFLVPGLKESLEEPLTKQSESLGREAKYLRTSRLMKLPYYLTVQFMRFYWKSDKNLKAKIVKPVEFPFVLDIYDLCTPDLQQRLLPKRKAMEEAEEKRLTEERERAKRKALESGMEDTDPKKDKKDDTLTPNFPSEPATTPRDAIFTSSAASPLTSSSTSLTPSPYVNDSGKYELCAVLTHKGRSADSGHYISYVKQAHDKWLKYDDDKVTEVNNEEIKKTDGKGGGDWHIAYLCLYRTYNSV